MSQRAEAAPAAGVVVRVGPAQHLGFLEGDEALPEYDGHHICVYLSDEGGASMPECFVDFFLICFRENSLQQWLCRAHPVKNGCTVGGRRSVSVNSLC